MARSNLQRRIVEVREAVKDLPRIAAGELQALADESHASRKAPDGTSWAPTKKGEPFDPAGHIRYEAVRHGDEVALRSSHPAADFARLGTRHMEARPGAPPDDAGAGKWLRRIATACRSRLRGRAG